VTEYLAAHGPPAWYKLKKKAAQRAAREEAARRRWRVVVVGAGPAGLTAALHLKVGRQAGGDLAGRQRWGWGWIAPQTADAVCIAADLALHALICPALPLLAAFVCSAMAPR
jgi:hypothetical protein